MGVQGRRTGHSRDSLPPDSTPMATPMYGSSHDHSFTLQAIMELQKSVSALTVSVESMKKSQDEVKMKVATFEKVLYAASVVLVIAVGGGGWLLSTAKDFVMLHYRTTLEAQQKAPVTPPSPQR